MNITKNCIRIIVFILCEFFLMNNVFASDSKIKLKIHSQAVVKILDWMESGCPQSKISEIADAPGNQLMEQILKSQLNSEKTDELKPNWKSFRLKILYLKVYMALIAHIKEGIRILNC